MSASYWLKSGAIAAVVIGGAGYFINAQFKADSAAVPPWLVRTPSPQAPVPLSPPQAALPVAQALPPPPKPSLSELQARCVAEVKANKPHVLGEETACEEFASASKLALSSQPVANTVHLLSPAMPQLASAGVRSTYATSACSVAPSANCLPFGPKGSIKYRECRARFRQTLIERCAKLKNDLDVGTGISNRACLRVEEQAYCVAAETFRTVEP
jgi:hypothetical protein